jgi:DNA-binding winged helix-turn-helix (wHTH) protein
MGHNGPRLAEASAAAVDAPTPNTTVVRFGPFDLDSKSGELRKGGDVVKLQPQPLKVLALRVRRSGEVVTRDEIRQHVWTGDTFVDFSQSLNPCMRQIREALGDDAETPRYIQTLPRRGYRFLLPIEPSQATPADPATRLIVLPFRILRPDPDTDFLAFSLPDAVTSSLSGLDALVVRSSIVASRFGSWPLDPKVIAAEADVDFVLTGSLLRSAE